MTYHSTWIIRYDETKTNSSKIRKQIDMIQGIKTVGCTGDRKER